MRRKLINQGKGNSLTLYLPKEYVDSFNLKSGDEVDISINEHRLAISPVSFMFEKEKVIQITTNDYSRIRTIISSAYRLGYNKISLRLKIKVSFSKISQIVDSLSGYQILEYNENSLTIENIMDDFKIDVKRLMSKYFITIHYFLVQIKEQKESEDIITLKSNILKLRDQLQRIIRMTRYEDEKSYEYYNIVSLLEKTVCSVPYRIYMIKNEQKAKEMIQLLEENLALIKFSINNKNLDTAISLNQKISKLLKAKKNVDESFLILENLFSISSKIVSILI